MVKWLKRLIWPSRSFVEAKFLQIGKNEAAIKNGIKDLEKTTASISKQTKNINKKADEFSVKYENLNRSCENIAQKSDAVSQKCDVISQKCNGQSDEINKLQAELLALKKESIQLQKNIIEQNRNLAIQQTQMNRLMARYQSELVGRIFEQIPDYMKGINTPQRDVRIIVSLTSFEKRIPFITPCVYSLLHQTMRPDKVLLWLSEENFPELEADLPTELLSLQKTGLEICWVKEDLKPHKKYFYAMQQYPDDIIITTDDDIVYRPQLIECLYKAYQKNPDSVYTTRARKIAFSEDGNMLPYNDWELFENSGMVGPDYALIPTGVGGVLYPPHCMDGEVFNKEEFMELCPYTDDLWLKFMQLKNGIPTTKIDWLFNLTYVEGSQENALYLVNQGESQNDLCIKKMIAHFRHKPDVLTQMKKLFR